MNQNKNSKSIIWGRFLNIVLHFCNRSTFHGLSQIARARKIRQRLFWIGICGGASLGFLVNIYYLLDKYIETPILTNVIQNYQRFIFPDISICFTNPIYYPPKNSKALRELMKNYKSYLFFKRNMNPFFTNRVNLAEYLYMTKTDFYGHQAWASFVACSYMGYDCSYQHFEIRHIYPYGICYTFNSTKINMKDIRKMNSFSGMQSVKPYFQITVYKAVDMGENFNVDPFDDVTIPGGVLVMIHDEYTFPFVGNSYILDAYSQIDLRITSKQHLNINNRCKSSQESYTYMDLFNNKSATFSAKTEDCVYKTIQINVMKNCKCIWQHYPPIVVPPSTKYCLDGTFSYNHLRSCLIKTHTEISDKYLPKCYQDLCDHKVFESVISQSKFPAVTERGTHGSWLEILATLEKNEIKHFGSSDLHMKALKRNNLSIKMTINKAFQLKRVDLLDDEFVDRNFMMLRVVPNSFFMDKVEETMEYPVSRLLSDVGGCVGLWVGASLITIFEFLDLIFDFFDVTIQLKKIRLREKQLLKQQSNSTQQLSSTKESDIFSNQHTTIEKSETNKNDGSMTEYIRNVDLILTH